VSRFRSGPLDGLEVNVADQTREVYFRLDAGRKNGQYLWAIYEMDADRNFYHLGTVEQQPVEAVSPLAKSAVVGFVIAKEGEKFVDPDSGQKVRTYNWQLKG